MTREMFLAFCCLAVAQRSTCQRANVGALIVNDNRIISLGYTGPPRKSLHCSKILCGDSLEKGCTRSVHAEINAILFAAREGLSVRGCTLWTTHAPCLACAGAIINSGINRIVYMREYRNSAGLELLISRDVQVIQCRIDDSVYSIMDSVYSDLSSMEMIDVTSK